MTILDTFAGIGGFSLAGHWAGMSTAGIGGFSLAGHWAGMSTAGFVEIDPFCQEVLKRNFPGVWIHDDIKTLTRDIVRDRVGHIDIITGGFPCQDISVAGKQAGLHGERSGLYFDLLRVITEIRPRFCLLENVPNLYHHGIDTVLGTLEEAGYTVEAYVVGADDIGAPHRRKRVFIIGETRVSNTQSKQSGGSVVASLLPDIGAGCQDMVNAEHTRPHETPNRRGTREGIEEGAGGRCQARENRQPARECHVPDTCCARCQGCTDCTEPEGERNSPPHQHCRRIVKSCVGGATTGISYRMDGRFPARPYQAQYEWEEPRTTEPQKGRAMRLKALGNTVVPQQVYPFLLAIRQRMEATK